MGLKIGKAVQTTLVANAFDSEDTPTAMNILGLMKEHGRDLDGHSYAVMLKGLRNSKDEEMIDDVLGMAWAKVEEVKDHFLAGEVLYWYYAQHVRKAAATWDKEEKAKIHDEALLQLVSLYTRIYDSTPLEILGFANLVPADAWSVSALTPALKPQPFVMNLMILAYTRARILASESDNVEDDLASFGTNFRLYQRWWLLGTRRQLFPSVPVWISKLFTKMMQDPRTLTVFMHALGSQNSTLYHAVKILERMEIGEFTHENEAGQHHTTKIAKPDLIAWSVLLNAFARHGQVEAAEKCFVTMRKKGIHPDATAWNTLAKVYAVAEDVEGVMRALQRKEDAGHRSQDDGIVRTLTRVKNKAALKELLQKEVTDREIPEETVLGRDEEAQQSSANSKPKWAPQLDEHVSYQPGAGKRSVMYFDANRTTGLHKEAYTVTEQEAVVGSDVRPGNRILVGQGSFSLKSDDEKDWFEDEEEEGDEFGWSPMMEAEEKKTPGVK
jgi:pentatricopeptide repeat protein